MPDRLDQLRPQIIRLRRATEALDVAQRRLTAAKAEHAAARQELDDALGVATDGIT